MADSGYGGKSRGRHQHGGSNAFIDKENYSPSKKARKSLASNWASSGLPPGGSSSGLHMRLHGHETGHDSSSSLTAPETPSKSLVGTSDASMLFSPPAILKEAVFPDDSGVASFGCNADSTMGGTPSMDSMRQHHQMSSMTGGARPLSGIGNRNSSGGIHNGNNSGGGSSTSGNKRGSGSSPPKSKVIYEQLCAYVIQKYLYL